MRIAASLFAGWLAAGSLGAVCAEANPRPCDVDNGGLKLPDGFCATTFASSVGSVRNLAIAENGDVFATLRAGSIRDGGVVSLRDTDGDGRADERHRFGRGSGHGIALSGEYLYYAAHDSVVRWKWEPGQLQPKGDPETVVNGFPKQRSHREKAIALGPANELLVSVGAPSNACQQKSRTPKSPGIDPCPQLGLQAGIWRYDASRSDQTHRSDARIATGLRHTLALAIQPGSGALWGAVNGRDQLGSLWNYPDEANAELPAEELARLGDGANLGWPYCYYDPQKRQKVLSPEYGGDGDEIGRCAEMDPPSLAFPAHWAPMAMAFYSKTAFPERYRGGLFVAFRGSWNRAPLPQKGYQVAFVPLPPGGAPTRYETFAIGAARENEFRMSGVAVAPDGSLYISADTNGLIWRIRANPPSASPAAREK
jgi:glucose/arabinose dehydrogenase